MANGTYRRLEREREESQKERMALPEGSDQCFQQVEGNLLIYVTLFKTLWGRYHYYSPFREKGKWRLRDVSDLSKGTLLVSSSCHLEAWQLRPICVVQHGDG